MNYLLTFLIFGGCMLAMAIGLIFANKVLRKGCSENPESCSCKIQGKDPANCDQ